MLDMGLVLDRLNEQRTTEVVVTTMSSVRPWGRRSESSLDFASADSAMAHAADFALGIALAQPERRVICLNGDGSMLMSLGTLATVVESGATNFVLFVMENRTYEITGNQRVPAAGRIDFPILAKSIGFPHAFHCDDEESLELTIDRALTTRGPVFASFVVQPGSEGPISRTPDEDAAYLQVSLKEAAYSLRSELTDTT